jgi:hypothetical protein
VANSTHLRAAWLGYVGPVPTSDVPDPLGLPRRRRKGTVVDPTGSTAPDHSGGARCEVDEAAGGSF